MKSVSALVLIGIALAVGTCDYGDAVDSQERYREAVCNGVWPDYLQLYPDCSIRRASDE